MRFHEPLLLPFASVAAGAAIARYEQLSQTELSVSFCALTTLGLVGYIAGSRRVAILSCLAGLVFAGAVISRSASAAGRPHPERSGQHSRDL